ncbi:hypothetical protein GTZ78_20235 [Streptomyces sp. SID8361]|uniref:hypothetical protein n=1 Tax=Streptomyces sp. MnatMP-M27 TaxID=1839768 RepID=UPI00081DFD9C|nr:hypothetical protein [Streptomyces sp. MnatMP-M27]MYU12964.1 hypothetical protein [Streptomyces sp. SID8361]SCF96618.1 hypothetical protein GA0115260_105122 [Streptomyces sp. MnatMP-M27]
MSVDAVQLAQDLTPYATTAITAYGAAVLARVEGDAADAAVSFGQRVLRRLTGCDTPDSETSAEQDALTETVSELAGTPGDVDLAAVLRVQIRRLITAHPDIAADIAAWARPAAPTTVTITTSGKRSPAVQTNYGTINTGDSTT